MTDGDLANKPTLNDVSEAFDDLRNYMPKLSFKNEK